jgi:hypothetical protein
MACGAGSGALTGKSFREATGVAMQSFRQQVNCQHVN